MTSPDAEGSNSGGKPLKIKGTLSVLLVFGFINLFAVGAVVLLAPPSRPGLFSEQVESRIDSRLESAAVIQFMFICLYVILVPSILRIKITLDSQSLTFIDMVQHRMLGKKVRVALADVWFVRIGTIGYIQEQLNQGAKSTPTPADASAAAGIATVATSGFPAAAGALAGAAASDRLATIWLVVVKKDISLLGMKLGAINGKDITELAEQLRLLGVDVQGNGKILGIKVIQDL